MDKISVVAVCYNESTERIRYTLSSIIQQIYPHVECIIVDGGSECKTIKALNDFSAYIDKFVSEKDEGIYDAMNKAVKMCTGEWVIFMNIGDRFSKPNVLTELVDKVSKDVDLVCGDILRNGTERMSFPDKVSSSYLCHHSLCHQAIFARRVIFTTIGGFDLNFRLVGDRDWVFRALAAGFKYKHLPIVICDWELGGACSDVERERHELLEYRRRYYRWNERVWFGFLRMCEKIWDRFRFTFTW